MRDWLLRHWYSAGPPPAGLRPLSTIYRWAADRRRTEGQALAQRESLAVPLIVVGNISVGGTGKTPLVIWLAEHLRHLGLRPGIVSRGYGGRAQYPCEVDAGTPARMAGDEPVLMARRLGCQVVVDPNRPRALRHLLRRDDVDAVISDDGLQHYRLPRSKEICVVDGERGLGNGALLPAGPLREPPARLGEVDLIVVNGGSWVPPSGVRTPWVRMVLDVNEARRLSDGECRGLSSFRGQRVHAVAGIGNPQRFFTTLRCAGIEPIEHAFPDHHRFTQADLSFPDGAPVFMTEKDAVKCGHLAGDLWFVPVEARLPQEAELLVRQWFLIP